jgi:glucose-induced degradation protein 8
MNNLVMDWLVSRGYKEAAESFAQEANMPLPQDNTIEQRVAIRNAINSGNALGAIDMVNELNPYVSKIFIRPCFLL